MEVSESALVNIKTEITGQEVNETLNTDEKESSMQNTSQYFNVQCTIEKCASTNTSNQQDIDKCFTKEAENIPSHDDSTFSQQDKTLMANEGESPELKLIIKKENVSNEQDIETSYQQDIGLFSGCSETESAKNKTRKLAERAECPICHQKFTINNVKAHIKTHTGEKAYKCPICEYKATKADALKQHIMKRHTGERPFKCDVCEYATTIKSQLKFHLRTHLGKKIHKCELCHYTSPHLTTYKRHVMSHSGEKKYKCHLCDYETMWGDSIKIHLRKHTGDLPFKCHLCDYKTAHSTTLKQHIQTHNGDKQHKCDICDYKSVYSRNLKQHIRTHTGERPFKCDMCSFKSSDKSSLIRHIRTHTAEKPYKCKHCAFSTAAPSSLKRHRLRFHPDNSSKTESKNNSQCKVECLNISNDGQLWKIPLIIPPELAKLREQSQTDSSLLWSKIEVSVEIDDTISHGPDTSSQEDPLG